MQKYSKYEGEIYSRRVKRVRRPLGKAEERISRFVFVNLLLNED